jgi:hypothetical protein
MAMTVTDLSLNRGRRNKNVCERLLLEIVYGVCYVLTISIDLVLLEKLPVAQLLRNSPQIL